MEYQKTGSIEKSSSKAGLSRKTGAKYIRRGELPCEHRTDRNWKTRQDPFKDVWPIASTKLTEAPELEGKALFEWICERYPGQFQEGQLRSFQRKIKQWRATEGPAKEVFFPQVHVPGKRLSFDFTHMDHLGVTIQGEAFAHMAFHAVLTYSNWEWVCLCHSESLLALRRGLQGTLLRLGYVPSEVWSDHSSAATHVPSRENPNERTFNERYLDLVKHFGMSPHTINVGKPHENGDVESANGSFKRRVKQHLLLRGSCDFESVDEYRQFLEGIANSANRQRTERLKEECKVMPPLKQRLLNEYDEKVVRVSSWSTISIMKKTYSLPSRLIGEQVKVRLFEDRLEVWYAQRCQETILRTPGRTQQINYRHVIDTLIRKPGAFDHYRYRDDLFPDLRLRKAYDELCSLLPKRRANLEYLRILKEAAHTCEADVLEALDELNRAKVSPTHHHVLEFLPFRENSVPEMKEFDVSVGAYDQLIQAGRYE